MAKEKQWGIVQIWNETLTFGRDKREVIPRDYCWASELGKNHYERWLKMNGKKPDFDFPERVLRKFEAGNFFERIIGFVLMSAGILIYDNKPMEIPADADHLRISVRPDFVAGGKVDMRKVEEDIATNPLFKLMPTLGKIAEQIAIQCSKNHPEGLKKLVFEIKSINSLVFWAKKDYLKDAYPHHSLQCLAEMKATGLNEGRILYISKDDLTTAEFPIFINDEKLNKMYEDDVRAITKCIREKVAPPKPDYVVFDKDKKLRFQFKTIKYVIEGCYVPNWEIGWSNYITQITGFTGKTQEEVAKKWEESLKAEMKEKNDKLKEEFKNNLIK